MVKTWADEAADCLEVVEPILGSLRDEIAPDLEWELVSADFEIVALDLVRGKVRSRVFVTFEAWVNASTDPTEIKDALQQLIEKVGDDTEATYVITSAGVVEKPRRISKEQLLDDVAGVEADAETEKLRKALRTPR